MNGMREEIDLVISDVVMPGMDGPTLLRELRRRQPELKIIFMSGYAEDAFERHLPDDQSFNFLPKPFSLKELAITVKTTLEGDAQGTSQRNSCERGRIWPAFPDCICLCWSRGT
jgi:DNA-binding NtrC family response regulator